MMTFKSLFFFVAIIVLFNFSAAQANPVFPTSLQHSAKRLLKKLIAVTKSTDSKSDRSDVMCIKSQNKSEGGACHAPPVNDPPDNTTACARDWLVHNGCGNVSLWILGCNDQTLNRNSKGVIPMLLKWKNMVQTSLKPPSRIKAIALYPLSHALAHSFRIEQNETLCASKPDGNVKDLTSKSSEDSAKNQTSPFQNVFNAYNLALYESLMTGRW